MGFMNFMGLGALWVLRALGVLYGFVWFYGVLGV